MYIAHVDIYIKLKFQLLTVSRSRLSPLYKITNRTHRMERFPNPPIWERAQGKHLKREENDYWKVKRAWSALLDGWTAMKKR